MSEDKSTRESRRTVAAFGILFSLFVVVLLVGFGFVWFGCRFYVPPGHMAVVTAKSGREPAPGAILVEEGERGIRRDVLTEGRHFFNPVQYDVKIVPAVSIPLGKVGIVTAKVGRELPPGEIIAPDREHKGVWRDVLGPGLYRLNPQGYQVEVADAVSIPIGYAGVVTSQTGKAPKPGEFAGPGEKGVLRDILQPGLYYLNRYAYQVNVIEIGMNQVTMSAGSNESVVAVRSRLMTSNVALDQLQEQTLQSQSLLRKEEAERRQSESSFSNSRSVAAERAVVTGKAAPAKAAPAPAISQEAQIFGVSHAVEFPSRDGFKVTLDMTVEFELLPAHLSRVYLLYGDLPQVVEKIILPQVLSVSRLKGSSYRAQDFIMGEGRETFQLDLRRELEKTLEAKSILVHNAIIRNVEIPLNILSPIRAVSLAHEQNLTNVSMQETARKLAELNTETKLIDQRAQEVTQGTRKLVAGIHAERDKEVAEINAETEVMAAKIRLQMSELRAEIIKIKGETKAQTDFEVASARAEGEQLRAKVLGGTGKLAEMKMIDSLNPQVKTRIIYAGEGTLWTDLSSAALALPAASGGKQK